MGVEIYSVRICLWTIEYGLTLEGYEGADGDYYFFLWKEYRHGQNKYSHLTTDPKGYDMSRCPIPEDIFSRSIHVQEEKNLCLIFILDRK